MKVKYDENLWYDIERMGNQVFSKAIRNQVFLFTNTK